MNGRRYDQKKEYPCIGDCGHIRDKNRRLASFVKVVKGTAGLRVVYPYPGAVLAHEKPVGVSFIVAIPYIAKNVSAFALQVVQNGR